MTAGSCLLSTTASRSYRKNGVFEDLKMIDVPVLVMQGEDDQICPFESSGAKSVKLLKYGTLKTYPGFPHGMATTNADRINADILEFVTASEVTDTSAA
jgi:non-heme chloroperoxidase